MKSAAIDRFKEMKCRYRINKKPFVDFCPLAKINDSDAIHDFQYVFLENPSLAGRRNYSRPLSGQITGVEAEAVH
jgi:hypothetical protein